MKHIAILEIKLKFPFIYEKFEDAKTFKYDINEMIPERKECEKLKNINFFNQAKLSPGGIAIYWDDFIDIPSDGVYEYGEEIENF